MEMKTSEILLDEQYVNYISNRLYGASEPITVDRFFLRNCLWRNNELMKLREFYKENKALVDGIKIKEEMGL